VSRFGSDPRPFFDAVYHETPPWDVGGPQPAMAALLADYPPANPILDVGCGSGDLAIHLAQLGHEVLGLDFVDSAMAGAQEKVCTLHPEVARLMEFRLANALQPSLLERQFGAIVDSGFFHLFDPSQCDRFIDDLVLTFLPGGRYYLLAFAVEFPIPNVPRQVSAEELRTRFTAEKGWRILEIRAAQFLSRVAPPVPAICACMERLV
jgi:ubiquinone/menaquinone biosynthesis C-methylase UbiE